VPGLFEGVHVLRDPTYNVARWNLRSRALTIQDDQVLVDDRPLPMLPLQRLRSALCRSGRGQPVLYVRAAREAAVLYRRYADLLHRNGFTEPIGWPRAFSVFDNGVPIPDELRMRYLAMGDEVAKFGDPFASSPPASFYRAWRAEQAGLRALVEWLRRSVARAAGRVHARLQ